MSAKEKIAVIGSGLIGRSWAMLFAGAGYSVCLYDVKAEQLENAVIDIRHQLDNLSKNSLLRGSLTVNQQLALITTNTDLKECMHGAFYVQECVFEGLEFKKAIFKQLDAVAAKDQILASSTSTILPTDFTADLNHKENCIVAHPVNPPFYVPLVELVCNKWTTPHVLERTQALMREIGQKPVTLKKEVPGFALNRMQYALLAECWRLVKDGVMSPEDIDTVMTDGLGCRYAFVGPLEVTHLNAEGVDEYCQKYNKGYLAVCDTMGPAPSWEGDVLNEMKQVYEKKIPLNKLSERRKWRDTRLAALAKLKNEVDKNTQ